MNILLQANYCQAFILKVSRTGTDSLSKHASKSQPINNRLVSNKFYRWSQPTEASESLPIPQLLVSPKAKGHCADQSSLLWQKNLGTYTPWTLSFPHIQSFDWASRGWTQLEAREQGRLLIPPTDVTFSGHRAGWKRVKSGSEGAKDISGTITNK